MNYKFITIFENNKRLKILKRMCKLTNKKFETVYVEHRDEINRELHYLKSILESIAYKIEQPDYLIGCTYNRDIILNWSTNQGDYFGHFKDVLNMGVGIYEKNKVRSLINTLNPFYWVSRLFSGFIVFSFGQFGLLLSDKTTKILEITGYIISIISALLTIMLKVF